MTIMFFKLFIIFRI